MFRAAFPGIDGTNWSVTSPRTKQYNCIAWAAEDTAHWWQPIDPMLVFYWPPGVPREQTIDAIQQAFASLGYVPSADGGLEVGVQKVAIYAIGTRPTHAARQLPDGRWTSKLGPEEDIVHEEHALESGAYGHIVAYLRRAR